MQIVATGRAVNPSESARALIAVPSLMYGAPVPRKCLRLICVEWHTDLHNKIPCLSRIHHGHPSTFKSLSITHTRLSLRTPLSSSDTGIQFHFNKYRNKRAECDW